MNTPNSYTAADFFFILGAGDPEMERIKNLLREAGVEFTFAMADGKRVHPGNAYKATEAEQYPAPHQTVVTVECDVACIPGMHHIDHHREGDPGFAVSPANFMVGASVGQVFYFLRNAHLLDGEPGEDIVLAAAGDHCPGAAYRGECPGVDPDRLMAWRAANTAKFRGITLEQVMSEVEAARTAVRAKVEAGEAIPHFAETVPSLPEGSLREGVAVSYEMFDARARRRKVGLLNGSPEVIQKWIDEAPVRLGLVEIYGSPARGYAGGYLP